MISHINTEFWISSEGGGGDCQPWTPFQDSLVPRSFLINWPLLSLNFCARRAHTIPAPIPLKTYQEAHFISTFPNMQADLGFLVQKKMVFVSCSVLGLVSNMPNFKHAQFMHRHATAVYTYFCRVLVPLRLVVMQHSSCLLSSLLCKVVCKVILGCTVLPFALADFFKTRDL
jgi:hypothetical protein